MSAKGHLLAFLRDPKGVAALVPTSSATVDRIVSKAGPDPARVIVEYGPGTGVLTRRLLDALRPDGRLVAIELNEDMLSGLRCRLRDPRLELVHGSAEHIRDHLTALGIESADLVFSGIPFFWLAPPIARRIVANTHRSLVPGGRFVPYQMFYLGPRYLRVHLEDVFSTVRSEIELRNLPPYRIYEAVK